MNRRLKKGDFSLIPKFILGYFIALYIPLLIYAYVFLLTSFDITPVVYIVVVITILSSSYLNILESLFSLRPARAIKPIIKWYPTATAIVAAYLPNEEKVIKSTVNKILTSDYPGRLQVIVAYNTPTDLLIEQHLLEMAQNDQRIIVVKVPQSSSKADNINAALELVSGEFVGIFDADHEPDPDSFTRAWEWLSAGYDIVQGRCVIRNGESSWLTKLISVEFEIMYGLSHGGRSNFYNFGIFGGSNGYWKTNVLKNIKMKNNMLTEDIDATIRSLQSGYKIAYDPLIISRELSPVKFKSLWRQRMRWAQGWFQVSLAHLSSSLKSKNLTLRQKIGHIYLLLWCLLFPWVNLQIIPLIIFWSLKLHGVEKLNWFIPIFIFTTILTILVSPIQTFIAYSISVPEIRKYKKWFVLYFLNTILFYGLLKDAIAIVAQINHFTGDRSWKVTSRT